MKATEILKAFGLEKAQAHMDHCNKLSAIYKLLKDQQKNITAVDHSPAKVKIGRKTENSSKGVVVKYEGKEMEAVEFKVITTRGNYTVTVPINNSFFDAMCEVLNIKNNKPAVVVAAVKTLQLPGDIVESVKRALKYTSTDDLRPVMQTVCFDISNNKLQVVATNGHWIYLSKLYQLDGQHDNQQILIPAEHLKSLPKKAPATTSLGLLNDKEAVFCDIKCKLYDGGNRYPDYRCVIPEYKTSVVFDRVKCINNIKQVLPHANKSTKQVTFVFNGEIAMHACDKDFDFDSKARMVYKKKDVPDFYIANNGKFLLTIMEMFKSSDITMMTEGKCDRGCIYTDGVESVLMMPLLLQNEALTAAEELLAASTHIKQLPAVEEPAPVKAKTRPTKKKAAAVSETKVEEPAPIKPKVLPQVKKLPAGKVGKAVRVLSSYLEFICERNTDVILHAYTDKISIRFLRTDDRKLISGTRRFNTRNINQEMLLPALQNIIEQHGKKYFIKN